MTVTVNRPTGTQTFSGVMQLWPVGKSGSTLSMITEDGNKISVDVSNGVWRATG